MDIEIAMNWKVKKRKRKLVQWIQFKMILAVPSIGPHSKTQHSAVQHGTHSEWRQNNSKRSISATGEVMRIEQKLNRNKFTLFISNAVLLPYAELLCYTPTEWVISHNARMRSPKLEKRRIEKIIKQHAVPKYRQWVDPWREHFRSTNICVSGGILVWFHSLHFAIEASVSFETLRWIVAATSWYYPYFSVFRMHCT